MPGFIPPSEQAPVQAWIDAATEALGAASISPTGTRAATAPGLPERRPHASSLSDDEDDANDADPGRGPRRRASQRDSMRRREALLMGKEGSRRRQRWENDRLIGNPHAQPPLPRDWEVHPTYPRHAVPYFLAPLWDPEAAARRDAERKQRATRAKEAARAADAHAQAGVAAGHVPKDFRQSLKRARVARPLLQELEEEVRRFLAGWEAKREARQRAGLQDADSDEDEVVFVGRGGAMHDTPPSPNSKWTLVEGEDTDDDDDVRREKLVYGGLERDRQAALGRWLVHSIADYYNLRAWSVTTGKPARRDAYVGIRSMRTPGSITGALPRPLWGSV